MEIPDQKIVVAMDNIWIERIVGNLIQNSFKFTEDGGVIKVRVYKDKEFVFTEVIDDGRGIAEDKLKFIFERKYQADEDRKYLGYGLGLSIVKEMIERMGGEINVISKIGEGTTMCFKLPIYFDQFAPVKNSLYGGTERRSGVDRRQANRIKMIQNQIEQDKLIEKISVETSAYEDKSPNKPTILLCEDTPGQLHLLIESLKDDYNLIFASNGIQGLKKLDMYQEKVSLVLSDVKMPEMDGIEFCQKVFEQKRFQNIPLIFLTAYYNIGEQLKGLSYGATDYLAKPFNKAILCEKINHWLSRREHEIVLENLVTNLEYKNQEIGKLRSIISHEIRNPLVVLNSVHYCLSKLKKKYFDSDNKKEVEYWESLQNISRVMETINGVLDSVKIIESGMLESTLTKELVATILDDAVEETMHLTRLCEFKVENEISHDEYVWCDKRLITQVFVNLFRNAREAIDQKNETCGIIAVKIYKDNKTIRFEVKDNGAGISETHLQNLFGYRYTTKKDGTGIGLYFSKRILKVHGGDIIVHSKVGEGSTFIVVLPQNVEISKENILAV